MKQRTINAIIMALFVSLAVSGCSENALSNTDTQSKAATSVSAAADSETTTATTAPADDNEEAAAETTTTAAKAEEKAEAVSADSDDGESSLEVVTAEFTGSSSGIIDTTDLFSDRDLRQEADLEDAQTITAADGETVNITEAGVYVISGSASGCTIRVEADKEAKVQLVLDGVSITNEDAPAIYVVSADKCFITTASNSENTLEVTGTFTADGDTNTDAVIFSKDDLVLNGLGTLTINSTDNGISGKDDVKVTGGTYNITSAKAGIEANDSLSVCGGTFSITAGSDAIKCENSDDDTLGTVYISDGEFELSASSDGIQGVSAVQIDGGTINITASEGIEATYIQVNGGTIDITASDDGINASAKSSSYTPTIEFNGGYTTINMGAGDTDGVDANGSVYVNGGTVSVNTSGNSFDYDYTAEFNGGTIIINGEEVSEIPEDMMGGMGGFGGRGNMGDMGDMGGFGGRGNMGGAMA